jgi:hypothetical protein
VIGRIEALLAEAETLPDPRARGLARELAAAMVALVGEGLARVLAAEPALERRLADDELVGNLLVLCGMHPDPPAVRAEQALRAAGIACDVVPTAQGVRVVLAAPAARERVEEIAMSRAPDAETILVELDGRLLGPEGFVSIARLRT